MRAHRIGLQFPAAMDSKAGAIIWHGPHHLAVKSMTTTRWWVSEGTCFVCFRPYIFLNVAKKLLQCSQLFHGLGPGFTTRSSTFKGDRRTNDGTAVGRATNHTPYASHRSTSHASHHTPHIVGGNEGSCAAACGKYAAGRAPSSLLWSAFQDLFCVAVKPQNSTQ